MITKIDESKIKEINMKNEENHAMCIAVPTNCFCLTKTLRVLLVVIFLASIEGVDPTVSCRDRSYDLRLDGGLCFEIPPWQHQPIVLENHLVALKDRWGNGTSRRRQSLKALANNEVTRYMDTVLAPFIDTYHRNIQTSYQQLTAKLLQRIKDEISAAVQKKEKIYSQLTKLADDLKVPRMCDEERRLTRTVASRHVAQVYSCTEDARASINKMGKYAEEMISITKNHMQFSMEEVARTFGLETYREMRTVDIASCIKELSRAAAKLGYELDLSLTNARRHNEQSCERLTTCCSKAKKATEDTVKELTEFLHQCVYA